MPDSKKKFIVHYFILLFVVRVDRAGLLQKKTAKLGQKYAKTDEICDINKETEQRTELQ